MVCISVSLLLWWHWTRETGVASRSDFTPCIRCLLFRDFPTDHPSECKKPLTYLPLPKDPSQWHSFTRLQACSGPQRLYPDSTCWETYWLPASRELPDLTYWLPVWEAEWRKGSQSCRGIRLVWCPWYHGTLATRPWKWYWIPNSQTVIILSSLPFSHHTGIQMSLILHVKYLIRVFIPKWYNTVPRTVCVVIHRKKTYVISSPQEELIQSFDINGCLKLERPLMSVNSRASLLFLTF